MKIRRMILCIVILTLVFSGVGIQSGVEAAERENAIPPAIIAHRAGASFAPENTIAALEQAMRDGSLIAEIDVQQLCDGTLIVMHDSNFLRTAGVDKNVWETNLDELAEFEVGTAFSDAYAGEGIPTLEQMLQCAGSRIVLMIELKYTGHEKNLEAGVLSLLREYQMEKSCIIGSMNQELLKGIKELDENISTVFITHSLTDEQCWLDYVDSYSVEAVNLKSEQIEIIHGQDKPVYGWTVNNWETMGRALAYGVDGIVTDNVYLAQLYLRNNYIKTICHW